MPRFRLIALDLDGTLLNSGMKVSEANQEALHKAMDAGAHIVLATSRWFGLAKRTADRLGLETPIICSNGAEARYPDGREVFHLPLDAEAAREIVTWGDDHGWEMFTTVGTSTYMNPRPGIIPEKLPGGLKVAERQSAHLGDADPTCVQIWQEASVREVGERFAPKYEGRVRFSFNTPVGQPHYVVITHPKAEKATGLAAVCEALGVPAAETIAMGDSESDLAMLRWAGLGIAMRNSPDIVRKEALHIAPSNDEDGVAWAISRFVL
ncbi:MAG TPA: Cof-type HAD-IIB family hydrolase [Dehalococcoidia bacterium]|jgi:Cof subfamily protein (haloacid dehalogenase superfamily)|nr:Cof-type HAD-IIB family hydrolase [Dehalococcoidia bacterium]